MKTRNRSKRNRESVRALVSDAAWQPWMLPREVSHEIVKLIPPGYRMRFRFCFDDFGCFRCGRNDIAYRSLGFCEVCHTLITTRMRWSLKRHKKQLQASGGKPRVKWYMDQVDRAQELLADLRPRKRRSRKSAA